VCAQQGYKCFERSLQALSTTAYWRSSQISHLLHHLGPLAQLHTLCCCCSCDLLDPEGQLFNVTWPWGPD
jgi:hypothetical protein